MEKDENLTPEQEMDLIISQIRGYARRENLNAAQVKQMFDIGIMARGVFLDLWTEQPPTAASTSSF